MSDDDPAVGGYASPPCFAHELQAGAGGQVAVDAQTLRDVARWRKAERARLIAARMALSVAEKRAHSARLCTELHATLAGALSGVTVSLYWPFRGEPDLRGWMAEAHEGGARIALPAVVAKGAALVFHPWTPGCAMRRGVWNIPEPDTDETIVPDVTLSPLVGVDPEGYRLGYGGGFYDRTLAALSPRPKVIGVGHPLARIPTIFAQPWDIPMDVVLLGE